MVVEVDEVVVDGVGVVVCSLLVGDGGCYGGSFAGRVG